jgi:hypothetical protein
MEATMSEKKAYAALRKFVAIPDRMDRVENWVVAGMPDINFCGDGVECWIELKQPSEPKRKTTKLFGLNNHKLELSQRNWMLRQRSSGGRCFILIASCNYWILVDGKHADVVNNLTLDKCISIAEYAIEQPITDEKWRAIRERLVRK